MPTVSSACRYSVNINFFHFDFIELLLGHNYVERKFKSQHQSHETCISIVQPMQELWVLCVCARALCAAFCPEKYACVQYKSKGCKYTYVQYIHVVKSMAECYH